MKSCVYYREFDSVFGWVYSCSITSLSCRILALGEKFSLARISHQLAPLRQACAASNKTNKEHNNSIQHDNPIKSSKQDMYKKVSR